MHGAVVVGLLPAQAQRVAADFPLRGLKFIPRDREGELAEMTANFAQVFVMIKFISHATWRQIPRDKLLPINDGVADLKRNLTKLLPQEIPVATSHTDYSPIKAATPGERLFFRKPHGVQMNSFEQQVAASRSYYKRKHAIETEQTTMTDGISVLVNGQFNKPEPATPSGSEVAPLLRAADRAFWSEAYLRLISATPGASDDVLATRADAALAALLQRYPEA